MMNKFNNLPELFYFQADKNENNQHLLKLDSNNQVVSMSWLETKNLTKKIHNFLAKMLEVGKGRKLSTAESNLKHMAASFLYLYEKAQEAGLLDEDDDLLNFFNETIH